MLATGARESGVGAMKADAEAHKAAATAMDFAMILFFLVKTEGLLAHSGRRVTEMS